MRDEYDFSKEQRGKFYKPDATLNLPVEPGTRIAKAERNKGSE